MQNEGTLELTGSTLNAGLSNAGLLHVRYNRIYLKGGFTAAAGDTVRLDESSSLEVASALNNHGMIDFASLINVLQLNSGTLVNAADGAIRVLGYGGHSLVAELDNQGRVTVASSLTLDKAGAAHRNSGTLELTGGDRKSTRLNSSHTVI